MKKEKILGICFMAGMALLITIYLGMAYYYTDCFSLGTWINGIYCTGKTVSEVNAELMAEDLYNQVVIQYSEQWREVLHFPDEMVKADYSEQLNRILMQQNPFLWFQNMFGRNKNKGLLEGYSISPSMIIQEELLHQQVSKLAGVKAEQSRGKSVELYWDEKDGYVFQNNKLHILNENLLYEKVFCAIQSRQDVILLAESGCYYDEPLTVQEKELENLSKKLFEFLDFTITYQFGEVQEVYDSVAMSHWIQTGDSKLDFQLDEQGQFTWDMSQVECAMEALAEKYDTFGKPHSFVSTRGDVIVISNGTYGNELNQKAELSFLEQALIERKNQIREPEYLHKAWCQGIDDIGDTYVEVDMTQQKMYFYCQGKCLIETPVVTGNMVRKRETPEGVYYIYMKQKNRILKGPGYAAHVDYWMPVKNGIGIHDAVWREEFGGDIYKTDGSHGCINTPHDIMEQLYAMTEVGMPVILFY